MYSHIREVWMVFLGMKDISDESNSNNQYSIWCSRIGWNSSEWSHRAYVLDSLLFISQHVRRYLSWMFIIVISNFVVDVVEKSLIFPLIGLVTINIVDSGELCDIFLWLRLLPLWSDVMIRISISFDLSPIYPVIRPIALAIYDWHISQCCVYAPFYNELLLRRDKIMKGPSAKWIN